MHTLARGTAALTISALLSFAVATAIGQTPGAAPPPADEPAGAAPAAAPDGGTAATQPTVMIPTSRPAATRGVTPSKRVQFNFENAPIDSVLNYLSESLDFIVVKDPGRIEGTVTVHAKTDVTGEEAVNTLNTVLKEKGYTIQQNDRVLHVVSLEKGRQGAPVFFGADPTKIKATDQIITQVIPVGSVDATKLKNDLQPMLNPDATITSNQGSNSIVVTDTSANIRRMVEIIAALDQRREAVSDIQTFTLKYANATATATLINNIFKQDTTQGNQQQGGFGRGGFGRFFGPGGPGGNNQQAQTTDESTIGGKINAAADDRTNTVVVSGPTASLAAVGRIIKEIDNNPAIDSKFFIVNLKNAQAIDLEPVLNSMFGNSTSSSSNRGTTNNRSSTSNSFSSFGSGSSLGSNSGSFGGSSRGGSSSSNNRNTSSGSTYRPPTASSNGSNTNSAMAALQGQVFVVANEDTNSLLITTKTALEDQVRELIGELDRPIPQVLIKVLIAEVTHSDTDDIGVELSALDQRLSGNGITAGTDFGISSASGGLKIGLIEQNASATLRALASNNKLDVLSRPYILTSDNQEASMIVGQEVPVITNTQITDTGQTINSVTYQSVGIILDVTPHINPDGMVTLDIAPQVSQIDNGSSVTISTNVTAPIFDIRAAQSRVGVEDGKTIVIGGLMQDQKQQIIQKLPLLGDIPYLGMLFKRTETTKTKTELLIFLTPHVALRPDRLSGMSKDEQGGTKLVPNAVSPGTFQDQLRGMERGGIEQRPDARPAVPGTK